MYSDYVEKTTFLERSFILYIYTYILYFTFYILKK